MDSPASFTDGDAFCGACGNCILQGDKDEPVWHQFFRLIVVDKMEDKLANETFHLSGIGAVVGPRTQRNRKVLFVPDRRDEVVELAHDAGYSGLVASETRTVHIARYWSSQNCDKYPHGYPFHAKCWVLVEQFFGCQISQQHHLEDLVLAIRRYWYDNTYDLDKYMPLRRYTRPWIPYICYLLKVASDATWPYETDPVDIPEVKWLIQESTRRRPPRRNQKLAEARPSQLSTLPMDIYLRILDFLDDDQDVIHCGFAIGQPVPQSHWCRRLAGMIFEFSALRQGINIHWETAYFETKRLSKKALGLENRQRIWKALCSIEELYQMIRKGSSSPQRLSLYIRKTYPVYEGPVYSYQEHSCERRFPHTRFVEGDEPCDDLCECEKDPYPKERSEWRQWVNLRRSD